MTFDAATIASLAFAVAIAVNATKFLINSLFNLSPSDPQQNNVIRLWVFVVAGVIAGGDAFFSTPTLTRPVALQAVQLAFSVAIAAISGYHLLSGSGSSTATAPIVGSAATLAPLAPAALEFSAPTQPGSMTVTSTPPAAPAEAPAAPTPTA